MRLHCLPIVAAAVSFATLPTFKECRPAPGGAAGKA